MSDIRLPRRPIVELAPPVDGLEQVRGEAGRRRRRRAGVVGASLTAAAGVVVVLALSGGAGGLAVLKPAPPAAPGATVATPTPQRPGHVSADAPGHQHAVRAMPRLVTGKRGHRASQGPVGHVVAPVPNGNDRTPPPSGGPALTRWQSTYAASPARQCSGSTYGGPDSAFESSVGWCMDVTATPVSDGVRLHVQLCRDSTGGGSLSFDGTREVDLSVRQGTKTVWDWATLHPGSSGPHRLSEPANGCMNWSLVWPDVTTAGQPAGHGSFTFVGTSTANEMKGKPDESAAFSY